MIETYICPILKCTSVPMFCALRPLRQRILTAELSSFPKTAKPWSSCSLMALRCVCQKAWIYGSFDVLPLQKAISMDFDAEPLSLSELRWG